MKALCVSDKEYSRVHISLILLSVHNFNTLPAIKKLIVALIAVIDVANYELVRKWPIIWTLESYGRGGGVVPGAWRMLSDERQAALSWGSGGAPGGT